MPLIDPSHQLEIVWSFILTFVNLNTQGFLIKFTWLHSKYIFKNNFSGRCIFMIAYVKISMFCHSEVAYKFW